MVEVLQAIKKGEFDAVMSVVGLNNPSVAAIVPDLIIREYWMPRHPDLEFSHFWDEEWAKKVVRAATWSLEHSGLEIKHLVWDRERAIGLSTLCVGRLEDVILQRDGKCVLVVTVHVDELHGDFVVKLDTKDVKFPNNLSAKDLIGSVLEVAALKAFRSGRDGYVPVDVQFKRFLIYGSPKPVRGVL